jgi:hypothetical protein
MMTKRIASVLSIVFAVLGASAASAGAVTQSLELAWRPTPSTFNDLHIGDFFQINAPVSSLHTEPGKATEGTIACEEAPSGTFSGLKGNLETNNEKTDKAELSLGGGKLYAKIACTNNTALGTNVYVSMEPNGAQLNLTVGKKKAEIKEKSAAQPFYMTLTYSGGGKCHYAIKKLKGTLTIGPSSEVEENFQKQKFALRKDTSSTLGCPKGAAFSAMFISMWVQIESEQHFVVGFVH